ncbi:MAG: NrdH-redoxin [Candidatus Taylorbacteria bacterium CG11_big_fil_rev_8_21_14_0_20_46_11]|uniref:NrdH-redoxin n=1 Tax=Candidatus Taylorbacteria bacterium CG11_big_fil_rev_8_21_14_0_20_46_11 TaxID=1975025 RepID=A0A2H0K9T3_9BACT|nr:MAG: NrdH-redoxin [Candidatus Taylorbacteria bacterium CG11_big_fil_rev_8_21_14_0_20_46_11]
MSLIVYTKTGCPWCRDVLAFLKEKNIQFEEREVRGNVAYFDELRKKSGQEKTPTLDLDGDICADAGVEEVAVFLKEKKVLG